MRKITISSDEGRSGEKGGLMKITWCGWSRKLHEVGLNPDVCLTGGTRGASVSNPKK